MLAPKITGMMLEMDDADLVALLRDESMLQSQVDEALRVLRQYNQSATQLDCFLCSIHTCIHVLGIMCYVSLFWGIII